MKRNANPAANMLMSFAQQNKPDDIQRLILEEQLDPSAVTLKLFMLYIHII